MRHLLTTILVFVSFIPSYYLLAQASTGIEKQDSIVTSVRGVIQGADSAATITFRFYKDYITFEEMDYTASIQQGAFQIQFPLSVASPGFIIYNEQRLPVFLESGDELTIYSHHAAFIDSMQYFDKGALRNNYLKSSFQEFDQKEKTTLETAMVQHTSADFVAFMESYRQRKQDFLDDYLTSRDTCFSDTFQEYIEADILYWWGQNMMQYKDNHPASHLLPVALTLPDEFYDFVEGIELNNEKALSNTNYLKYLDLYTTWRQDRIEKGLLKVATKTTGKPKKVLTRVKRVETFAEIMMPDLQVREQAHDPKSVIDTLRQKDKVLYLRDITNDRFKYRYDGINYIDNFVKIRLPDGRVGWVFKMGVRIFEDLINEQVWVNLSQTPEKLINKVKYSSFRGKVLHYAVSKDLYEDIQKGKRVTRTDLTNYFRTSPYSEYVQIVNQAFAKRKYDQPIPPSSLRGTSDENTVKNQINTFTKNLIQLLELPEDTGLKKDKSKKKDLATTTIETKGEKEIAPAPIPKEKEQPIVPITKPIAPAPKKEILTEVKVAAANFAPYQQKTYLRLKTDFTTKDRPSIVFNQNPFLNDQQERKLGQVTTGRSYVTFTVDLATPSYWQLKNGVEAVDLYFEPGDDIKVDVTGSDIYTQTTFSGDRSTENNYLLAMASAFKEIPKKLKYQLKNADPSEFKVWLEDVRQQKLAFFYKNIETLNPSFIAYAEADINYWYAYNLMNYLYEHPMLNNATFPMTAPEGYLDFMNTISVHNDQALPNKQYILYLQEYLAYQQKRPENQGKTRYQLAEKYFSGQTKDFYTVILLSLDAKMADKRAALSHKINSFENTALEAVYAEYVKKAFHKAKGLAVGMHAPAFALKDKFGKTVRLEDLRGQVVMLDFWATWCGPCVDLMPVHHSLQERYADRNVTFVYVAMDNNATIWKNFLNNKQLKGQHLIADEAMGFKSSVSKDYQIKFLPYTLILDTNGRVAWKRTGGFGVSTVSGIIDQLLH